MPILSNILVSTDGPKTVRLAATDLYLAVTSNTPCEVQEGGSVAVAARTLFDIVKNMPEGDIHLTVGENNAAEIRNGKVRYKIPGMPGQDFPALPSPGETEFANLDVDVVGELIALTQYSMSTDETRPHLAGALFEGDGKLIRMVTTDGHRLSKAERKLGDGTDMLNFSMLVPAKGIAELKRLLDDARADRPKGEEAPLKVEIATSGGNAFVRRDGVQLSVKLADEHFPPYSRVIPQSYERRLVLARSVLGEALRRISLMASDKSGAIRFNLEEGVLRLTSENPDVGEASEEIDVDYAGEPLEVGFNARYMLDVLNALSTDDVALELGGQLDPGVVRPATGEVDFVGVIMPMRI